MLSWRWRSRFSRSSSAAGNAALRTMSASSRVICGAYSASTSLSTMVRSAPTSTLTWPPMAAACRAMSAALRPAVPSSRKSPARSASQVCPPSFRLPARTTTLTVAFGSVPKPTSVASSPFSRPKLSFSGSEKSFGSPPGGGVSFAGCVSCAPAVVASRRAASTAVVAMTAMPASGRMRIGCAVLLFIGCLLLFACRGAGFQHEYRAVRRSQVFLRRLQDQIRRDCQDALLEFVDESGVAVEQRERSQDVRAAEAVHAAQVVVERGAPFHRRALQCVGVHRLRAQPLDHLVDDAGNAPGGDVVVVDEVGLPEHRAVVVQHVAQEGIDAARHRRSDAGILHQRLVQQAVLALNQDLVDETHGVPLRGEARRHVVGESVARPRRQLLHPARALLALLARLADVRQHNLFFRTLHIAKVLLDEA